MKKTPTEKLIPRETVTTEVTANQSQGGPPPISRRHMAVGLLTALAGGLSVIRPARAFELGAHGNFNAAGSILGRYGVAVIGDERIGDLLSFEIVPLANTDYSQIIGTRSLAGGIIPCVKTLAFADADADVRLFEATHFHPTDDGLIIPGVKTVIDGHTKATHELFDSDSFERNTGEVAPCFTVESEMLNGGHIGKVVATHLHPTDDGSIIPCVRTTIEEHTRATYELFDVDVPSLKVESEMGANGELGAVKVIVGNHTYNLVEGALVPEERLPT